MSGATRMVAEWAGALRTTGTHDAVRHQARRILVDYVAATVVGATTPLSRRLQAQLADDAPGDQATVVGGPRLSAAGAAFANGTAAHGLEIDDGYTPGSVHPGAVTVPAVLAAAELVDASPDEVLTAVAAGIEITCRVAEAGHPGTLRAGFHNTPSAGVLGAAVGAGVVLGADARQLADALGLAGSHAGGLREYHASGADVKRLHAGKAARDGLGSARMAVAGVTGPHTVLEGAEGYFAALAHGDWDPGALLDGLGERWACLGTYVKPYPCCRHLHAPIDAVLALVESGLDVDAVTAVSVETFAIAARHDRRRSASQLEAQLSIPFGVATALRHGSPGFDAFGTAAVADPGTARLAELVTVTCAPDLDAEYPLARPARVTVRTGDGRERQCMVQHPLGEPANPIDDAGLGAKFTRLVGPVLGDERAEALLGRLWSVAELAPLTTDLGVDGRRPGPTPQTGFDTRHERGTA